jgi:hypothetical protein
MTILRALAIEVYTEHVTTQPSLRDATRMPARTTAGRRGPTPGGADLRAFSDFWLLTSNLTRLQTCQDGIHMRRASITSASPGMLNASFDLV